MEDKLLKLNFFLDNLKLEKKSQEEDKSHPYNVHPDTSFSCQSSIDVLYSKKDPMWAHTSSSALLPFTVSASQNQTLCVSWLPHPHHSWIAPLFGFVWSFLIAGPTVYTVGRKAGTQCCGLLTASSQGLIMSISPMTGGDNLGLMITKMSSWFSDVNWLLSSLKLILS